MSAESKRRLKKRNESERRKRKKRNKTISDIIANRNSLPPIRFSDIYEDMFKLKPNNRW